CLAAAAAPALVHLAAARLRRGRFRAATRSLEEARPVRVTRRLRAALVTPPARGLALGMRGSESRSRFGARREPVATAPVRAAAPAAAERLVEAAAARRL